MAVRSKRLWGPSLVTIAAVTLYTAPAGETTILKQLALVNNAGAAQTLFLYINGTANNNRIYRVQLAADSALLLSELFVVLQPGDTLQATSGAGSIVVTGFGAELEGVAD